MRPFGHEMYILQQNAHLHACALMQQQVAHLANNADLMTLALSQQGSPPGMHHTSTMMLCRLWQRRMLPLLSQSGASASWAWPTASLLLWPQRATAGPSLCSSCARTTRSLPATVCLGSLPMHSTYPVYACWHWSHEAYCNRTMSHCGCFVCRNATCMLLEASWQTRPFHPLLRAQATTGQTLSWKNEWMNECRC